MQEAQGGNHMFSPTTRRGFLGRASALAAGAFGLLADPFGIVGHSSRGAAGEQAQPPPDQVGELYAGFVLVRPGEPHPAALTLPKVGPPILEQIGGGPLPTGHTQTITRAEAAALGVELWTLRGMPATSFEATFTGTNLFTLALLSDVASEGFSTLTVVCQPNFPKPYPVMP